MSWKSSKLSDFSKWPKHIDILLTHLGPFRGRLENISHKRSTSLFNEVIKRNIPLHLFGHYHFARGIYFYKNTIFINCSTVGNDSISLADPVLIEYDKVEKRFKLECRKAKDKKGFYGSKYHKWTKGHIYVYILT